MDEDSEQHRALKNSLLAIMFNGTFNERNDNGLVEHSGLCVLDFDDYPDAATMMKNGKDCKIVRLFIWYSLHQVAKD
jgi:hypothetical protein